MAEAAKETVNLVYVRDLGHSLSLRGYNSAISLFNHFLVNVLNETEIEDYEIERLDANVEDILRGYSMWLCDTKQTSPRITTRPE